MKVNQLVNLGNLKRITYFINYYVVTLLYHWVRLYSEGFILIHSLLVFPLSSQLLFFMIVRITWLPHINKSFMVLKINKLGIYSILTNITFNQIPPQWDYDHQVGYTWLIFQMTFFSWTKKWICLIYICFPYSSIPPSANIFIDTTVLVWVHWETIF